MADVVANQVGGSFGDGNDAQKNVFDLGAFVGDLTFEEDASGDDISFEGLAKELEECKNYDVVENILSKGTTLREYTKGVENDLRQVEIDSIQDYIKESDNLVSLHDQIRDCDAILSQMETLLSGFQVAESKLAKFVEDIIIPPRMVDIIVYGEVFCCLFGFSFKHDGFIILFCNCSYVFFLKVSWVSGALFMWSKFMSASPCHDSVFDRHRKSKSFYTDVSACKLQPFMEKDSGGGEISFLWAELVFDFIVQKLYTLRKPKTNIQILQQNVLLKYK
ncbi:hypothetical protein Patl1_06932 [Pistacia atlantica]|uniref:Uncharacterized protein n=1 Tax=Pistacia atlantica TaxID=434234 RepID=A0ACC1AKT1_9ROSI|nr:hypothetical protein Patl1_06932 [Pistacia atlantica]